MLTKNLSLIIFAVLFPLTVLAAPSISGYTGTMSNGQSITISGSDFGNTGPSILVFDDFELQSSGVTLSSQVRAAQVGSWRSVANMEGTYPTYSNIFAHSGTNAVRFNFNDTVGILDCGYSGTGWISPVSGSVFQNIYFSFWTYLPAGQNVPGNGAYCSGSPNWKVWWLSTNDTFQNDYSSEIITDPPTETSICWTDGSTNRACWGYGSFSFTKGRWLRWEGYLSASTSSGSIYLWHTDSGQARNLVGSDTGRTIDDGTTGWQYIHFPGYGRPDANSNLYYDDIYIATGTGARARVEIGNNATYTSCTNLAVCTPTSWGDTSITATVRTGSFGTTGTAYLYVTDSDGSTNSTGYEVTLVVYRHIGGSPPR